MLTAQATAGLTAIFDPGPTDIARDVFTACMPDPEDHPQLASIPPAARSAMNDAIVHSYVRRHACGDFGTEGLLTAPTQADRDAGDSAPRDVRNTISVLDRRGSAVSRYAHLPPGQADPVTIEIVTAWRQVPYGTVRGVETVTQPMTTVRLVGN